jgi:hypothetical protein
MEHFKFIQTILNLVTKYAPSRSGSKKLSFLLLSFSLSLGLSLSLNVPITIARWRSIDNGLRSVAISISVVGWCRSISSSIAKPVHERTGNIANDVTQETEV